MKSGTEPTGSSRISSGLRSHAYNKKDHTLSEPSYLLSIDNGTQSVRALLFDTQGNLLAKGKVELDPVSYTHLDVYKRQSEHRAYAEYSRRSLSGWLQGKHPLHLPVRPDRQAA